MVSRQSYGGHSERETPGPIPNPEVKPFSADGTATARSWESRTPPDILCSSPASSEAGLLAFSRSTRDGTANGSGVARRQERVVVVPAQHELHELESFSGPRGPAGSAPSSRSAASRARRVPMPCGCGGGAPPDLAPSQPACNVPSRCGKRQALQGSDPLVVPDEWLQLAKTRSDRASPLRTTAKLTRRSAASKFLQVVPPLVARVIRTVCV